MTFEHPSHALTLLRCTDGKALQQLCDDVPDDKLEVVLVKVLSELRCDHVEAVVVPLLNTAELRDSLVTLLCELDSEGVVQVIAKASPERLAVVLRARSEALAALVSHIQLSRITEVIIPMLEMEVELLATKLLPLMAEVEDPRRLASAINLVEKDVLQWFLEWGDPQRLAALITGLDEADLEAEGSAIVLLNRLADHRGMVRDKVMPLIKQAETAKIVQLIQGTKAENMLEVLHHVEVDGLLRLMDHTNADFAVRVLNGPVDMAIAIVAYGVADALKYETFRAPARQLTDVLNDGCKLVDKAAADIAHTIGLGKEERGAPDGDYQFGDYTRGVLVTTSAMKDSLVETFERQKEAILQAHESNMNYLRQFTHQQADVEAVAAASGEATSAPCSVSPARDTSWELGSDLEPQLVERDLQGERPPSSTSTSPCIGGNVSVTSTPPLSGRSRRRQHDGCSGGKFGVQDEPHVDADRGGGFQDSASSSGPNLHSRRRPAADQLRVDASQTASGVQDADDLQEMASPPLAPLAGALGRSKQALTEVIGKAEEGKQKLVDRLKEAGGEKLVDDVRKGMNELRDKAQRFDCQRSAGHQYTMQSATEMQL